MRQTLSILDTNDLLNTKAIEHFALSRDKKDLRSFLDGFRQAMLDDSRSVISPRRPLDYANYLPSSSLRGDSGCSHWDCRLPKVRALARYIALYCDSAVVPVPLDRIGAWLDHTGELLERLHLVSLIRGIAELRPLIESGLITLVPEELHLCKRHWNQAVPEHKRIVTTATELSKKNSDRFTIRYIPPTEPLWRPVLEFIGPEDFLEHGRIVTVLDSVPRWLQKRIGTRPVKLSKKAVDSHRLVLRFFLHIANDALLQSYFGTAFNARYVTDSEGEAEFFRTLYKHDELALNTATLCARLTHTVPLLQEVPLERIIKLRQEEPAAFENYRSTLTVILKKYAPKGIGDSEAREIYLDLLKPQLDALEVQAVNARRSQLKRNVLKVAISSALIGVGIYSGILPTQLAKLVEAIGGFTIAKDLAETILTAEKNPLEVRNHNLYFLLRLKQDGG